MSLDFFQVRSAGKVSRQMTEQIRFMFVQRLSNPKVAINTVSPHEDYAKELVGQADLLGFDLEMTIPKQQGGELWVSQLHSIKLRNGGGRG